MPWTPIRNINNYMSEQITAQKKEEAPQPFDEPFRVIRKPAVKSRTLLKTIREKDSCYKFYGWDLMQNYAYIAYLINFRHIFDSQLERKRVKVFRHLSKLIKTRNAHQIKSHHQKMMIRHENVDGIIQFVRSKVSREIQDNPDLVPIIRQINQQSELFFLREVTRSSISSSSKQSQEISNCKEEMGLKALESSSLKQEEYQESDSSFPQVKCEEIQKPDSVPIESCLKQEEAENVIWQKYD